MQALSAGRGVAQQIPLFEAAAGSPRDVEIYALSNPARAFTGDFYFTHREGDRMWLAVGDVAGHGIHAAVVMGMIQEELEQRIVSCATDDCDPAITMQRLHLFLRDLLPRNRFVTAVIAQIQDDGSLRIANGGHVPVLIARRDGSMETIGSTGPVIGLLDTAQWRSIDVPFHHGDTLLAITDGVTESRSKSDDELGLCRLRDAFANAAVKHGSAREIAADIQSMLHSHSGDRRDDDVTIIVARR
jgi:phosphoserine phosphatase RsbU/P